MRIKRADEDARGTIRGILEKFLWDDSNWYLPRYSQLFAEACSGFGLQCLPTAAFFAKIGENPYLALRDKDHFAVLEPPDHGQFLPFLTLHSDDDDWVHFRVYVILAALDENSKVQGVVFRYETDEGDGNGKHDFCHAQICRSVRPNGNAVTPFWMLKSDPAIPLEADNQIRLVLCMLTSIYGRQWVLKKFDRNDGKVLEQMKGIRSLRPNPPAR